MEIIFNHHSLHLPEGSSLWDVIIQKYPVHQEGIAVAVNQRVIPKSEWKEIFLSEKDQVLIITATQGG